MLHVLIFVFSVTLYFKHQTRHQMLCYLCWELSDLRSREKACLSEIFLCSFGEAERHVSRSDCVRPIMSFACIAAVESISLKGV